MKDAAPEMELLCCVLRHAILGRDPSEETMALLPGINWHHLLWRARQHRVLLVLRHLVTLPGLAGFCSPEIIAQLQAFHEVSQLRSLARSREVCQVQDLFDRHGIGAIMVDRWLAGNEGDGWSGLIEPSSGLHCLVSAGDMTHARAILAAAGHPLESDPGKLIKVGFSRVKLEDRFGRADSSPRLWKNSFPVTRGERTFRRLAVAHWLLVRAPNPSASGEITLGRAAEIVSLARLIAVDEWPDVLREASLFGRVERFTAGVAACYQILELPTPRGFPEPSITALATAIAPAVDDPPAGPNVTAPFLPTPPVVVERMLKLAGTGPNDLVCDLGCGDGRIVIRAAKGFGARGRGTDRDPARIVEAATRAHAAGVSGRVSFACGDLFAAKIADATVVTCYLLPQFQPPLLEKIRREAQPGTRVVSHEFVFSDWPPERTEIIRTGLLKISQIYLWRMPEIS